MKKLEGRSGPGRWLFPIATALAVLLAPACRRGPPPRTLRVALETDVLSDDPHAASDGVTNSVLANVFEPLVAFDREMVLGAKLAVAWDTVDPSTWVLRLRPGVTFHDGAPLTSHEVRLSLERARNGASSAVKGAVFSIRSMEETDAATLRIVTSRPDPLLLNRLAQVPILRVAEDGRLVGTGPYRITKWTKGATSLEAEEVPRWWGGRPPFPRVVFTTVSPGPAVVEALRSRSVDLLRFVPETLVDEVKKLPDVTVVAHTSLTSTYLWMDSRPAPGAHRNPFADARVRRAISLAVDRGAVVKALSGNALALDQMIPRGIFGHVASAVAVHRDVAEAKRLLAEAGYPAGFETPLVRPPGPVSERVADLLAGSLAELGIRTTIESPPWEKIFEDWRSARMPFFVASWRFENGDAASFLQDCLVTRNVTTGFGRNNPGYSNAELDRLVEESEGAVEPSKRLPIYEEMSRLFATDVPIVPLYHRYNLFAVTKGLRFEPRLDGRILVTDVKPEDAP